MEYIYLRPEKVIFIAESFINYGITLGDRISFNWIVKIILFLKTSKNSLFFYISF